MASFPFLSASYRFSTNLTAFLLLTIGINSQYYQIAGMSDGNRGESSSFYDILSKYALPVGIFPKGISDFSLDRTTGRFQLRLPQSCSAQFETDVWFDATVTGTLSYGHISDLSGVAAQELFLWLAVKAIHVDVPSSGLIYFDIGVVSKQFSLSYFETPRDCAASDIEKDASSLLQPWHDFISFDDQGRVVESQPRKFVKEPYREHEGRAVS